MKKLLKEIGIRLLSIALVSLLLIAVSTIGSYLTGSNSLSTSSDHELSSSYTFEQPILTPTPTKPIVTPTPKPTPVLRDRLDPKQIEHVYFFYSAPADEEALKVAKLLSKYVNVTFCKVIANGSKVDLPLRKEYIRCAKVLDEKFSTEIWGIPPFSTPSLIAEMNVTNVTEFLNKYDSDNFVNLGCSYDENETPHGYLYYWGTNESYTVPMSIDWFYAQITGKFLKPPAYAKREYHSYDKESENVTALELGPNYIPKPIKPLNPNDVKLIIFADMYGVNDDVKKPIIENILRKLRQYIPNAKLIKLTYWWYPNGSITSDPPGYEDYYDKYVVPYAKYYDPYYGKWFLDFPCVILILKDGSHRTYGDTMSYKDYCEIVKNMGYSGCPYCIYPPIDRLFLDIQAYYKQVKTNSTEKRN